MFSDFFFWITGSGEKYAPLEIPKEERMEVVGRASVLARMKW